MTVQETNERVLNLEDRETSRPIANMAARSLSVLERRIHEECMSKPNKVGALDTDCVGMF